MSGEMAFMLLRLVIACSWMPLAIVWWRVDRAAKRDEQNR